ncbi:hypothetical protein ACMATS_37905 (plasmid) [Streptoverticillium reticulum]|uniref:hypothetical protein n=1 Tax=Streptoverticillium reticulum TaxID=1433415 RepID=UPI0039BF097E
MTEIEHVAEETLNRVPAEFRPLLNLDHLTTFTLDRQREHNNDVSGYEAGYVVFQIALRSQHIDGDHRFAARLRARKVEKHWRALVKASRDAAQAMESLRLAYADHVRVVQALPGERAQKKADREQKKASRRTSVNALAAKSLHKTAASMAPRPPEGEVTDGETGAHASDPAAGARVVRGVNDLFDRKGA